MNDQAREVVVGETQADAIVDHPDATPILVVATLGDNVGIRCYGPPSLAIADLLDQVARDYRVAVQSLLLRTES